MTVVLKFSQRLLNVEHLEVTPYHYVENLLSRRLPATTLEALGICVLYVEGTKDFILLAIILRLVMK